jgi:ribosome-binding factor A
MSNRTVRINELVQRELSEILRRRFQTEAVALTITEVRVAPDLRDARVFVSVVGSDEEAADRMRWLRRQASAMREELGRRIVLKYLPRFEYVLDKSAARSVRVLQILDEIERADAKRPALTGLP